VRLRDLAPGAELVGKRWLFEPLLVLRFLLFCCGVRPLLRLVELIDDIDLGLCADGIEQLTDSVEVSQRFAVLHHAVEMRGSIPRIER